MFHVCLLLKEGKGVLGSEKHYPVRNISVVWCGQLLQADTVIDQVFVAAWVQRPRERRHCHHHKWSPANWAISSIPLIITRSWHQARLIRGCCCHALVHVNTKIFCFVLHFVASLSYSFQDIPVISPQKAKQCSDFWQTGSVMWPQANLQC